MGRDHVTRAIQLLGLGSAKIVLKRTPLLKLREILNSQSRAIGAIIRKGQTSDLAFAVSTVFLTAV
jgi:hypothetical protein